VEPFGVEGFVDLPDPPESISLKSDTIIMLR
jgi:hypothetical protein